MQALQGLSEAYASFGALEQGARDEMVVELGEVGRELLDVQRAEVAKKTGYLASQLSLRILVDQLRIRIGLFGSGRDRRSKYDASTFYGRFVEFGRRAQTVLVTRRLKRRIKGNGRNGTKRRAIYEGKPYRMKVKAMAAQPFIAQPFYRDVAEAGLADYYARLVARGGGAV